MPYQSNIFGYLRMPNLRALAFKMLKNGDYRSIKIITELMDGLHRGG